MRKIDVAKIVRRGGERPMRKLTGAWHFARRVMQAPAAEATPGDFRHGGWVQRCGEDMGPFKIIMGDYDLLLGKRPTTSRWLGANQDNPIGANSRLTNMSCPFGEPWV